MKKKLGKISLSLVVLALALSLFSGCGSKTVTSTFTLMGNTPQGEGAFMSNNVWIDGEKCEVGEGATALDVISSAMETGGYSFSDESYIYSVTRPDGQSLSAGDMGENSGWIYAVNDVIPDVGMGDCEIADGDRVLLRFVEDFNTEVDWSTNTFID